MKILEHPNLQRFFQYLDSQSGPFTVVFDCDGTMVKGDVGEAMLYHQIEHFLFRRSPSEIWTDYPEKESLDRHFRALQAATQDERASHPSFAPFADAVLDWYFGQIERGLVAKACTDIVRLFSGFPLSEVRAIAAQSFQDELRAAVHSRILGRRALPRGIRYIQESLDLFRAIKRRDLEVWVVSGSSKWSVEPVFDRLGVERDHIIGIELVERDTVLSDEGITPVPIRADKVEALRRHTDRVPVLVVSDSRNDIPLFRYSSFLKVRINSRGRSTDEFFGDVGESPNGLWVNVEAPTILEHPEDHV
jgi:phosphoserine phosphatase